MPHREADADLTGDSITGLPSVRTSSLIAADWLFAIGLQTAPVHPGKDQYAAELRQDTRVPEYLLPSAELNHLEIELEVRDDSAGEEPAISSGLHRFWINTLREVLEMVLSLGRMCGMYDEAMRLLAEGEKRIALSTPAAGSPRVTVLTSLDPPMLGRRWIPGLVELTGACRGI